MNFPSSKYELDVTHTIPARGSVAVCLFAHQKLTVINTHGTQVVDFWAFKLPADVVASQTPPDRPVDLTTYLSMSHTRAALLALSPIAPCILYTNERAPILKFLSDSSGMVHDTIIPACDRERYRQLGAPDHDSCCDNLRIALARDVGQIHVLPAPFATTGTAPDPFNLFMNIPVHRLSEALHESNTTAGGKLSFEPTISPKGGEVMFEAMMDCIVAMSCCPQDLVPINHGGPTECQFLVQE